MRIAQVSPLYESVPPQFYGGTERVISYLTEELVRLGHEVTLFASSDSRTSARLVPYGSQALRLDSNCVDPLAHHIAMLQEVYDRARAFDIIHFHTGYLHFPWARHLPVPSITTLHGRLDLPGFLTLFSSYRDIPTVSISISQRKPLPFCNWKATIHHGLPKSLYKLRQKPGSYLAFLGRISPEKGVDAAIEIARRAGINLKIAAKVGDEDREYYKTVIKPLLYNLQIEFLGEIKDYEKDELLGDALALLFPINWPEPFGLVLIEAMACGTPVVAFRSGAVPEIVQQNVTGFITRDLDEAVKAVSKIALLNRRNCRLAFEDRFTVFRMANQYVETYEAIINKRSDRGIQKFQRCKDA